MALTAKSARNYPQISPITQIQAEPRVQAGPERVDLKSSRVKSSVLRAVVLRAVVYDKLL